MRTAALAVTVFAAIAAPAKAADIERNEALVMRIVFDDCLGYIRDGKQPFDGVGTFPLVREEVVRGPPAHMTVRREVVHLINQRYQAAWGEDTTGLRFCLVFTDITADDPMQLGVDPWGFLARVTERAAREGLTEALVGNEFSPIEMSVWSEPEEHPGYNRVVIMPTGENNDGTVLDAGLVAVAGAPPANAVE